MSVPRDKSKEAPVNAAAAISLQGALVLCSAVYVLSAL